MVPKDTTTLKELLPEGYEVQKDYTKACDKALMLMDGTKVVSIIPCVKSEESHFDRYWKEYLGQFRHISYELTKQVANCSNMFKRKDYENIPFEIKIGLLKFICEKNHIRLFSFLTSMDRNRKYAKILDICPVEFMTSIDL